MNMEELKCLRCGMCCYVIIDGKPSDIPCPYLVIKEDGTTLCRIYLRNRINRKIGHNNKCTMRTNSPFDYEGCPYNTNKSVVKIGSDGKHYLEVKNEKKKR